jgi:1,4-dihydroxy-2-naphthoate octaprenyltransferase
MENALVHKLRGGWKLLRFIAVISSSFVAILSSLLPLLLYTSLSAETFILMFIFLGLGATIVHGVLVHLFNDYADNLTGTDAHSPGILSGGSRVIQEGFMQPAYVLKLGKWVAAVLLVMAAIVAMLGYIEVTFLILVGIWAAISYSLPPISLSYRPFLGEWLSLFPAIFFLGIAGPWLLLDAVPVWAYQNAVINALVCMGWVMVHHIPDVNADIKAKPKKQTSVVWFVERFGMEFAKVPALLYFFIAGLCTIWVGIDRLTAGIIAAIFLVIGMAFIMKADSRNVEQVTRCEQILLLLAILIGLVLGIF